LQFIDEKDAYGLIQYFMFGGSFGIVTVPQLHRFQQSGLDNDGVDLFISKLRQESGYR
jgi:hypothetical protein